ncbi:hypothetical protein HPB50_020603 [Hyalomma asiaticum]|uniref:Uncharacterized protein n=1 Tax=Hyalomma asiaticum TaxID=266040 RepID=A0ACB7S2B6_HYAAI|nr:hypothetical protein HPB50_020603 [Hyalomma asiaticum]
MLARRDPFSQPFPSFLPARLHAAHRGQLTAGATLATLSPRVIPFLPSALTDALAFSSPFSSRRLTCSLGSGFLTGAGAAAVARYKARTGNSTDKRHQRLMPPPTSRHRGPKTSTRRSSVRWDKSCSFHVVPAQSLIREKGIRVHYPNHVFFCGTKLRHQLAFAPSGNSETE